MKKGPHPEIATVKKLQMIAAINPSKVGNFGRELLTLRERIHSC